MKIIAPATAEPISLELARRQCRVDAEGSPPVHIDDDLIMMYVSAAREWCEMYLGTNIAPATAEIRLSAFPTAEITLESGPVLGVLQITYLDVDSAEQLVPDTVYELDSTGQVAVIRLRADQSWPDTDASNNNVSIQYSIGYSLPGTSPQDAPLPKSIQIAILLLTSHLYKHRDSTTEVALAEIPMGVKFFLFPFRLKLGFA